MLSIYEFNINILSKHEFYVKFMLANFYLEQNLIPCANSLTKCSKNGKMKLYQEHMLKFAELFYF